MGYLILFLLIIITLVSLEYPDTMFWIFITFLFDPGGYIYYYLNPFLKETIKVTDIIFILSFIPMFSVKIRRSDFFSDKLAMSFIWFFLLFCTYYIFIYGFFQTDYNLNEFVSSFLIKRRLDILGFLLIIPVFIFAKRSLQKFITITAIVSVLFLLMYFISLFSGLKLIPYVEFARYVGSDLNIMRKSMFYLGTAEFLVPIAIGCFLIKRRWKMKTWIIMGGILMIITQILSLGKNSIFSLVIIFLVMIYFISKLNSKFRLQYLVRYILFILFILSIIVLLFPNYLDYSLQVFGDIFRMFNGQNTLAGTKVTSRFDVQVPIQTAIFLKNPMFGAGYSDLWYTMKGFKLGLGSNDIPVVSAFAMFGIIGSIFYFVLYIKIFKLCINAYRLIKRYNLFSNLNQLAIELLLIFSSIAFFISKGINVIMWFSDLTTYFYKFPMLLYLGILLATYHQLKIFVAKIQKQNTLPSTENNSNLNL